VLDWMRPLEGNNSTFPIAAQIKKQYNGEIVTLRYDLRGRLYLGDVTHPHDLMLDINEQQVEVHFYQNIKTKEIITTTVKNNLVLQDNLWFKYITSKTITIEL